MFSEADCAINEVAASRDGIVTFDDARVKGLSRREIDYRVGRVWRPLFRGVYIVRGAPLSPRAMLRAACLAGAPHAAVSHRAAAALYEVPGGRIELAELTCPRWLRTAHPSLIVHESNRIDPADVREVDGIPVMRPERVLIELASIYRSPDFIEVVPHAMLRKRLVTFASTHATLDRLAGRGRRGVRVTRAVLERWEPSARPTESPPETSLLQILRDAGLGRVVPQLEIFDAAGAFVARPDATLPDDKIAVEYDSDAEHTDEMSLARDNARRNRLMAIGWIVVSARKDDVRRGGHQVVAAIAAHRSRPQLA